MSLCYHRSWFVMRRKLKSTTAIFLSAWLGFLACLLGCAPAFASPAVSECPTTEATNAATEAPSSCCEHHKRPGGRPDKSSQPLSCCPLNATLHKQTNASAVAVQPPAVAVVLITIPSLPPFSSVLENPPH